MTLRETLAERLKPMPHDVPELGTVLIRRITGNDAENVSAKDGLKSAFSLVSAAVLDANGTPLFASAEDAAQADWPMVQRLLKLCNQVNAVNVDAAEKK
jgi:hypothetical protein